MPQPRILFVLQYHLLRMTAGAEEQAWLLSRELAARGWDVHYASEMNELPSPPVVEGVTLHGLPENPDKWRGNREPLKRLMQELKPDVVYNTVFDLYTGHSMLEAPAGSFRIWTGAGQGDGFIWPKLSLIRRNYGSFRMLKNFPYWYHVMRLAKRGARAADLVFAQRQEQFDDLKAAGYPVELLRNVQPDVPEDEVQTHEGEPMVLWAAKVKDWKRPMKFIELARECQDLPGRFVMIGAIGEAKYKAPVLQATQELSNFDYDGLIPLDRVGDYFRRAHLFVNTSISEGYPTTFIQAWQRGVPCASIGIDPERLLSEQHFGLAAKDMAGLVEAVRSLLQNPDRRREMGQRAMVFARREYSVRTAVDKLEQLLAARGVRIPQR